MTRLTDLINQRIKWLEGKMNDEILMAEAHIGTVREKATAQIVKLEKLLEELEQKEASFFRRICQWFRGLFL